MTGNAVTLSEGQTILVAKGELARRPVTSAIGPNTIGFCVPLVLDGTSSEGILLSYEWTCVNDADLDQRLRAQPANRPHIQASDLVQEDFDYELSLIVTDFVGTRSTVVYKRVYRSDLALPVMVIDQPPFSLIEAGRDIYLQGTSAFSVCVGR